MTDSMCLTFSRASSKTTAGPGLINCQNHQLQLPLPATVDMSKDEWEITLDSITLPKSWFNVHEMYNNTILEYIWIDGQTYTIHFENGGYSISDINAYIQQVMLSRGQYLLYTDSNGHQIYKYFISIVSNLTYYTNTLTCTPIPSTLLTGYTNPADFNLPSIPTTPQLILPSNDLSNYGSIADLIGFTPGTYPGTAQSTIYQINGSATGSEAPRDPVQIVALNCSLVHANTYNTFPSAIWTISPNCVKYGNVLSFSLNEKNWFRCQPICNISSIVLSLIDQSQNPLPILDSNIVATVQLRRR